MTWNRFLPLKNDLLPGIVYNHFSGIINYSAAIYHSPIGGDDIDRTVTSLKRPVARDKIYLIISY